MAGKKFPGCEVFDACWSWWWKSNTWMKCTLITFPGCEVFHACWSWCWKSNTWMKCTFNHFHCLWSSWCMFILVPEKQHLNEMHINHFHWLWSFWCMFILVPEKQHLNEMHILSLSLAVKFLVLVDPGAGKATLEWNAHLIIFTGCKVFGACWSWCWKSNTWMKCTLITFPGCEVFDACWSWWWKSNTWMKCTFKNFHWLWSFWCLLILVLEKQHLNEMHV